VSTREEESATKRSQKNKSSSQQQKQEHLVCGEWGKTGERIEIVHIQKGRSICCRKDPGGGEGAKGEKREGKERDSNTWQLQQSAMTLKRRRV